MKVTISFIFVLLLTLVPLYLRSISESQNLLVSARSRLKASDIMGAIEFYRQAISWDSPFNSYALEASSDLFTIGTDSKKYDGNTRLLALRELKSGLLSSRSVIQPRRDSSAMIQIEKELKKFNNKPARLREQSSPQINYNFQILAQAAFWLWIASVWFLAFRGFQKDGKIIFPEMRKGLAFSLIFYALWLWSLSQA